MLHINCCETCLQVKIKVKVVQEQLFTQSALDCIITYWLRILSGGRSGEGK